uniref:Chaperone protein DnaJ isoform X3 n=1 Tax=Cymbidium ensifolium TaxID=78740 RepID=A0A5B9MQA5_CYMEN|nr:chaperone protein DnaJ isoform X3 [Cymbidium ensifolium]
MTPRSLILEFSQPISAERKIDGEVHKARAFTTADFASHEFSGKSAYEVLGISEKSSSAEIKASFRKLAKETHPDVCTSGDETAASFRFLQILAAYEILSDSERRVHYDIYLFSQKKVLQKKSGYSSVMYTYNSTISIPKPDEVVEWLKWYKHVINDIVAQKKVATGSGYLSKLESELYSAIHFAYHGPIIESLNLLPNSFEAEERSLCETSEVLHLVSGRYLFGIIYTVDKVLELSHLHSEKLASFESSKCGAFQCYSKERMGVNSGVLGGECSQELEAQQNQNHVTDVYKNLELHISGKLVATATRSLPHCKSKCGSMADNEDHINVFLQLNENIYIDDESPQSSNVVGSKILLGTITGLGSNAEEGICSVYDRNGQKNSCDSKA